MGKWLRRSSPKCNVAEGIITLDDLAAMKPVVREPLAGKFGGIAVLSMPPPSSGGVALIETLNLLTALENLHPQAGLEKLPHNRSSYLHLLAESFKHAFADRAAFLGDSDFAKVPVARLTSQRVRRRAGAADRSRAHEAPRNLRTDDDSR